LKALTRRFRGVRFVWLMGSDNLDQFHRWRRWEEIAALVPIAVVLRPGSVLAPLRAKAMRRFALSREQTLRPPPAIIVVDGRRNEANATAIRAGLEGAKPSC
jgi:nicotinate-nucleotide adenylyltransferase